MAGLIDRITRAFGASKTAPADVAAEADDRQAELLQQVRRAAAEVAASRRTLAGQMTSIASQMDTLTVTARRAVEQGRSELAREALARKQGLAQQLGSLENQHDQLQREEERLVITSTRLRAKIDAIRAQHHSEWARLAATEAQQRVQAAFESISGELGAADQAVRQGQASVAASDALLQAPEPIDQAAAEVAAELAAMQTEVAQRAAERETDGRYRQPGEAGGKIQDEWGS